MREILRLGELVYLIVKHLFGSSGEGNFDGGPFHKLKEWHVHIFYGTLMSFFEKYNDHSLTTVFSFFHLR